MQNLSIFSLQSVIFSLVSSCIPKGSICSSINLLLALINEEMVLSQLLSPPDLPSAQGLCIHKLTKVVINNKDKDLMLAFSQVVVPSLKGFNNSQEVFHQGFRIGSQLGSFFWRKRLLNYISQFQKQKALGLCRSHTLK